MTAGRRELYGVRQQIPGDLLEPMKQLRSLRRVGRGVQVLVRLLEVRIGVGDGVVIALKAAFATPIRIFAKAK